MGRRCSILIFMTEVIFRNYSHPGLEGGVKGWVSEVEISPGGTVAHVALSSGVLHAELAEKVTGYGNLNIPLPATPEVPDADGLILVSYAGNGPSGPVEIIQRFLSRGEELRVKSPDIYRHITAGLVAATLAACEVGAPRYGTLDVDDDMVKAFSRRWVEL